MWFPLILLAVFVHQSYEAGVTLDSYKTPCSCGSVNRRTRIVGGSEAEIGEYPWMVEIKQVVEVGRTSTGPINEIIDLCGGALVNKDYCITAAHCFVRITDIKQLLVYLGDHDSTTTNEVNSVIKAVISKVQHPNYNTTTQANDIAIIKLNSSVTYQWNIQSICIPPSGVNYFQQELVITGWGATDAAGPSSPTLREVSIPVIPNVDCKILYQGTVAKIDDSTVCAGTSDGSKDACQGDSGGPACWQCPDDGDYSLGGVVSYGIGCGNPKYPGVFTNVSYYLSWIKQNIPGSSLCGSQCYPSQTQSDCGWANDTPPRKKRIVGGSETTANKYPWVVSVYKYLLNSNTGSYEWQFSCAGSVISNYWILSTAKCVSGVQLTDIFLVVGDYDLTVLYEPGELEVFPEKIVIHPNYNVPLLSNDVALIKLTAKLTFNAYVRPVCLPSTTALSPTVSNTYLKLIGWGRNVTGGKHSTKLKEVWLYAITNEQCSVKYPSTITASMICTASSSQGDACEGDNGGPLMLQGQSGRFYAAALQSFRYADKCGSGNPSGHMRITSFLSWIESICGVRPASTSDRLPV